MGDADFELGGCWEAGGPEFGGSGPSSGFELADVSVEKQDEHAVAVGGVAAC